MTRKTTPRSLPFLVLTLVGSVAFAQAHPADSETGAALGASVSATSIAARVQAFYDRTDTLQARFAQTYYSRLYGRYQRSRGQLALDKPGRLRFDYDAPNGKVFVSDGHHLTAYEPGEEGAPGQYLKTDVRGNSTVGGLAFLTGQSRITEDYRVRLLNARTYRWSGHVLELVPRQADPRVRRVLLYVDARAETAGVVHRIRIDDHEGNRNKLEFRGMRFNRDIDGDHFRFRPPAGAIQI